MKRYFSSEDEAEVKMVKVESVKRGTISGRYGIFHFDPKGKDPRAKSRTVRSEVAIEAKAKGLVKIVGNGSARTTGDATPGEFIGTVAASRRETSITKDGEEARLSQYFGAGSGETRDTTAFAADPSKTARVDRFTVQPTTGEGLDVEDLVEGGESDPDEDEDLDDETDPDLEDVEGALTGATDDTLAQEGNARGADAPPAEDDDVTDQAGSDQGRGGDATDDTGAATDQVDEETKIEAVEAAPTAAPRPRGRRRASGND